MYVDFVWCYVGPSISVLSFLSPFYKSFCQCPVTNPYCSLHFVIEHFTSARLSQLFGLSGKDSLLLLIQLVPYKVVMSHILVDTEAAVADMVDSMLNLPIYPPSLYLDIEGLSLGRYGTISIVQAKVIPEGQVFLVDVTKLGHLAFDTAASTGVTFRSILENDQIPKVFFDVRNDSDALYANYSIKLAFVQDLQLMEMACRWRSKEYVMSLAKCIQFHVAMERDQRNEWFFTKEHGKHLLKGGSHEIFNVRPISHRIIDYCVNDVEYMPDLWETYEALLESRYHPAEQILWKRRIQRESEARVNVALDKNFLPNGPGKTKGPWGRDMPIQRHGRHTLYMDRRLQSTVHTLYSRVHLDNPEMDKDSDYYWPRADPRWWEPNTDWYGD